MKDEYKMAKKGVKFKKRVKFVQPKATDGAQFFNHTLDNVAAGLLTAGGEEDRENHGHLQLTLGRASAHDKIPSDQKTMMQEKLDSNDADRESESTDQYENLLWVGVHSANSNFDRRENYRSGDLYKFMKEKNIPLKFLMGHPEYHGSGHTQGIVMTEEQLKVIERVNKEQEKYNDIYFLTLPDTYFTLDDKLFDLLRLGEESNASFVMKSDDDFEITTQLLNKVIEKLISLRSTYGPDHVLYGGGYIFKGDEYRQMYGPHREHSKYFSGAAPTIFSHHLTQYLSDMNFLFTYYGNSSEDKTVGEMIHKIQMDKNITVDYHLFEFQ